MDKLSAESIAARLDDVADWVHVGDALQRTISFADFVAAIAFVDRIAEYAESVEHHPDIMIRYDKVTLVLSTHDAGGLTDRDFEFARAVDELTPGEESTRRADA